ncbi:MAG: ribonuclease I [Candidatus Electrothrix aestuarii]|uniref:Ribonuclease I n=1 Tax=Candidatus Electrothrix aestuarii TaxID=3062594 RepID=A0AAU8LQ09_9BACT|nr:hypothetical protein [Candidatus Electrothrix aestuarii]
MKKRILTALIVVLCSGTALASEKASGTFEAVRSCEAYSSFKKGTNPGLIKVTAGSSYEIVEVNKPKEWNWIRISMDGPSNNLRWVAKECGNTEIISSDQKSEHGGQPVCSTPNKYDSYVLAMTWQPGFCEHYSYKGKKPECDAMMEEGDKKLVISHLTLHGLWPNKDECGKKYGNCSKIKMDLREDTVATMAPWMPNFYFSTNFGNYEWSKHGTCQERDDDTYFLLAKDLLQRVDKSAVGTYLRESIGETINLNEYRQHVEENLGKEVAERMQVLCSKRKFLQEIRINLPKEIVPDDDIAKMVSGAKTFNSFTSRCDKEIYIERSGKD